MSQNFNLWKVRYPLIMILLTSLAFGCKKDPAPEKPQSEGTFTASFDNEFWQPIWYSAIYYSKSKMLYLEASSTGKELAVGISIDPNSILKQYPLEPNGTNAANFSKGHEKFISDHNSSDAGGNFILTKFDTIDGKLSANINFRGYSPDGLKQISFGDSKIENIKLVVDDTSHIDGYVNVTVEGAKTTNWYSTSLFPQISCIYNGVHQTLELQIASPIGYISQSRALVMQIPLELGVGNFEVKPDVPPYFYCGAKNLTVKYRMGDYDINYFPISGSVNIISMDTVARNLKASFDFTVRESVSNKTIHFANGQVNLINWHKMR